MSKDSQNWVTYAIGDIHGMYDHLIALMGKIKSDYTDYPKGTTCRLVFLGDYIDRGPKSRDCVEYLMANEFGLENAHCIFLKGNHEDMMLDHYAAQDTHSWHRNGGLETEDSYAKGRVTKRHRDWISRCPLCYAQGGYFFVHAGVDPDAALEEQSEEVLLWIRDKFLDHEGAYTYEGQTVKIVHGHSPEDTPVHKDNRICVDTGAYYTGTLTAVALDGRNERFLSVTL